MLKIVTQLQYFLFNFCDKHYEIKLHQSLKVKITKKQNSLFYICKIESKKREILKICDRFQRRNEIWEYNLTI